MVIISISYMILTLFLFLCIHLVNLLREDEVDPQIEDY